MRATAERLVSEHFKARINKPDRGRIEIGGERYILVRAPALSVEFHNLIRQLFNDSTSATSQVAADLLFQLAQSVGRSDAVAIHRELGLHDPLAKLVAGPAHFAHAGWASVEILESSRVENTDDFVLHYKHPYSFESTSWVATGTRTTSPVCHMNAGYSSGWVSASFQQDLTAVEVQCVAQGDPCCRFIMAPPDRLRAHADAFFNAHPELADRRDRVTLPTNIDTVRLAQRLELSEARYRRLFETSIDAILVVRDGRVVDANRASERLLHLSTRELTERELHTLCPPSQTDGTPSADGLAEHCATALGGPPTTFSWQFSQADGATVETEVAMARIEGSTELELIIRDRTAELEAEQAHLRLEQEMRQLQKMEALGTLAGGIAHDFNNLLATMSINLELLETVTHDPDGQQWLSGARKGLDRSAGIVQQLLTFARSSQDTDEALDLAELVDDNVSMIRDTIDRRIQVQLDLPTSAAVLLGNPNYLAQVVVNLLLNSRDALTGRLSRRQKARIEVEVRTEERTSPEGELVDVVGLVVRDNGSGMTQPVRDRVFEPFFTTKGAGSGLGLSTVYGIVHQHGGWLELETEPNEGTEVSAWFPAVDREVQAAQSSPAPVESPRALTVLVAEDEQDLRETTSAVLRSRGHRVIEAEDGQAGLEAYLANQADLDVVLLDLTMPRLSGRALLARILHANPSQRVVVTSGFSDEGQASEVIALGAAAFLPKPWRLATLISAVEDKSPLP